MIEFALLVALLIASGFFSGSETALFALTDVELGEMAEGNARERRAVELVRRPERTLATILLSNMILNVVISVLATTVALRIFGSAGIAIAIPVATILLLLFGEIVPKSVGLRQSRPIARLAAPILGILTRVLGPIAGLLESMAAAVAGPPVQSSLDREELGTLVRVAHREGDLTRFEARVLGRVLPFEETPIERCMTPRVDVVRVARDATATEARAAFHLSGRSRLPVFEQDSENVVGVLLLKDLLTREDDAEDSIESLVREVRFEPASLGAGELFRRFQRDRSHLAIVVGEHGGVEGLVTLEDLLEELIGDVRDESDELPREFERLEDGSYRGDGRLELEEVALALGIDADLEDDEAVTVAGLLQRELGRVPLPGDEIEWCGWRVQVRTATPNRVGLVHLTRSEGGAA